MSKDWIDDEPTTPQPPAEGVTDLPPDADEPAPPPGGRPKLIFALLLVGGAAVTLKATGLHTRLFPAASPQTASARPVEVAPKPSTVVATQPAPAAPTTRLPPPPAPTVDPFASKPPSEPAPVASASPAPEPPAIRPAVGPSSALLGIRAAQQDRRVARTYNQLQTVRSQIELYKLQHNDKGPEFTRYPAWHQLTHATRADGTIDPKADVGPYLTDEPVNALNHSRSVGLTRRIPKAGERLRIDAPLGWVYCLTNQTVYATDADGKTILDETRAAETAQRWLRTPENSGAQAQRK